MSNFINPTSTATTRIARMAIMTRSNSGIREAVLPGSPDLDCPLRLLACSVRVAVDLETRCA
jgi:hypothetical protein